MLAPCSGTCLSRRGSSPLLTARGPPLPCLGALGSLGSPWLFHRLCRPCYVRCWDTCTRTFRLSCRFSRFSCRFSRPRAHFQPMLLFAGPLDLARSRAQLGCFLRGGPRVAPAAPRTVLRTRLRVAPVASRSFGVSLQGAPRRLEHSPRRHPRRLYSRRFSPRGVAQRLLETSRWGGERSS